MAARSSMVVMHSTLGKYKGSKPYAASAAACAAYVRVCVSAPCAMLRVLPQSAQDKCSKRVVPVPHVMNTRKRSRVRQRSGARGRA